MKKRARSEIRKQAKINKALRTLEPTMIPLLELFAVVDDVFTEEGAFTQEHIKQSLGRTYRQWKETRSALDPSFDPKDYERKPRRVGTNASSPLAMALQQSSTDRASISEKSRKRTGSKGKRPAKTSVRRAR